VYQFEKIVFVMI